MTTFAAILGRAAPEGTIPDQAVRAKLEAVGVSVELHVIRDWRLRGRIPAEYWNAFVRARLAKLADLAAAAEARKFSPDKAA